MERFRDYFIIFLVFLFVAFWYYGLTASASSLYDVDDPESPWYQDETETHTEEYSFPDYAVDEDGSFLINNDTSLDDVLHPDSVSGGDAVPEVPADYVTYADMEAIVSDALADSRAANLSVANAYLSSAIVEVFSRVVDGFPAHYKYAAYRINSNDANEGFLLIGADAKVNGNYLDFPAGSQLAHYYRVGYQSGYQTYYDYKYDVSEIYDTYRVPYNSGQLVYTNMVSGYPTLSETTESHIASYVIPVFVVALCLFIIMRRKK